MKLIINAIECLHCQEVIVSRHRHEMVSCVCGTVSVDGGNEYRRRGFRSGSEDYLEACVWAVDILSRENHDLSRKWIVFSPQGKSNSSVAFDRHVDAVASATQMKERFKDENFYVAELGAIT
jgi:hypothetical protein